MEEEIRKQPYKKKVVVPQVGPNEEGKLPPQATDLEISVLGAILVDKDAINDAIGILDVESFYKDAHGIIFEAMVSLFRKSEPIDLLTVTQELREKGKLEICGGAFYITKLTQGINSSANMEFHARIIQEKFIARELIKISNETIRGAYDDTTDIFELKDSTDTKIFNLTNNLSENNSTTLGEVFLENIKEIENHKPNTPIGISTGYPDLDKFIKGLKKGNLIIVGGRPAMGKTTFALNIAEYVSINLNIGVMFYSYEMSKTELVYKVMASRFEIPLEKLTEMDKEVLGHLMKSDPYYEIINSQLHIDDTVTKTIIQVRSHVKKMVKKYNIKVVIVDYIQLMPVSKESKRANREGDIADISRGLKLIAKEFELTVIALSQLSRQSVNRGKGDPPRLEDLRESGAIEQDADIVLFPHRPEYYGIQVDDEGNSTAGLAQIIGAKNRNGVPNFRFNLNWQGMYSRFVNRGVNDSYVSIPSSGQVKQESDEEVEPF
jgi:replicative DNA helicase